MKKYKAAWLGPKGHNSDAPSIAMDDAGHQVGFWISSSEGYAHIDLPHCWAPGEVELEWVKPEDMPPTCPGCAECKNEVAIVSDPETQFPVGSLVEISSECWHPNFGLYMTMWYVGHITKQKPDGIYWVELPDGSIRVARHRDIKLKVQS